MRIDGQTECVWYNTAGEWRSNIPCARKARRSVCVKLSYVQLPSLASMWTNVRSIFPLAYSYRVKSTAAAVGAVLYVQAVSLPQGRTVFPPLRKGNVTRAHGNWPTFRNGSVVARILASIQEGKASSDAPTLESFRHIGHQTHERTSSRSTPSEFPPVIYRGILHVHVSRSFTALPAAASSAPSSSFPSPSAPSSSVRFAGSVLFAGCLLDLLSAHVLAPREVRPFKDFAKNLWCASSNCLLLFWNH